MTRLRFWLIRVHSTQKYILCIPKGQKEKRFIMAKINKEALAERVQQLVELGEGVRSTKKNAVAYTTAVFEALAAELNDGNSVAIANHGVYETRTRKARKGRNPKSGQEIDIPETKTVGLRVTGLRKAVQA
jgi:DNA-binding protein HU-beta